MSQQSTAETAEKEAAISTFVEQNTTPNSPWISEGEIVWVLSWYQDVEPTDVRDTLTEMVDRHEILATENRYTRPELL